MLADLLPARACPKTRSFGVGVGLKPRSADPGTHPASLTGVTRWETNAKQKQLGAGQELSWPLLCK